jgi:acetoin utilization protein AcuB
MKPDDQVYRWMTPSPQTVGAEATLFDAIVIMRRYGIRHLPVLDRGELVGIVSERDLAFAERFLDSRHSRIDSMMTREPYVTVPYASMADVCRVMAANKYGAAIVCDGPNVVGVFTAVDALRAIAETTQSARSASVHPADQSGE